MLIQNQKVGEIVRDITKIDVNQQWPSQLSGSVSPIIDVTPNKNLLMKTAPLTATASATSNNIITNLPEGTLVWGIQMSLIKDATCDVATGSFVIAGTKLGEASSSSFAVLPVLTLTAQQMNSTVMFEKPIAIKAGTNIAFSQGTFTAGNFVRSCCLYYTN